MKTVIKRLLPIVSVLLLIAAGCAKQNVVKQEAPPLPTAPPPAVTTEAATPTTPPTTPAPLAGNEEKTSPQATALQNQLEKIYFGFDSSTLSDKARQTLSKNFAILKQHPRGKITVEGHCDERGSDAYNLALGQRRAQAAINYLTTMGIPPERLAPLSYGKEKPADPGHDETAWTRNRRDEFVVSP